MKVKEEIAYINVRWMDTPPQTPFVEFSESMWHWEPGCYAIIMKGRMEEVKRILKHIKQL